MVLASTKNSRTKLAIVTQILIQVVTMWPLPQAFLKGKKRKIGLTVTDIKMRVALLVSSLSRPESPRRLGFLRRRPVSMTVHGLKASNSSVFCAKEYKLTVYFQQNSTIL